MFIKLFIFLLTIQNLQSVVIYIDAQKNVTREINNEFAFFGHILDYGANLTGYLAIGYPIDGCSSIKPVENNSLRSYIVLLERGNGCYFDTKVRNAQNANYSGVIIYNNESDDIFPISAKNASGIILTSVFIGKSDGQYLKLYYSENSTILIENDEYNLLFTLLIPIIIFILIALIVTLGFLIYRFIFFYIKESKKHLSRRNLKKLKKLTFNSESNRYETCAVCLEDFVNGDKLRILPCDHGYHCKCIDPWLLKERRVCPICKYVIRFPGEPESSELDDQQPHSSENLFESHDETQALLGSHNQTSFLSRIFARILDLRRSSSTNSRQVLRVWEETENQHTNEIVSLDNSSTNENERNHFDENENTTFHRENENNNNSESNGARDSFEKSQ